LYGGGNIGSRKGTLTRRTDFKCGPLSATARLRLSTIVGQTFERTWPALQGLSPPPQFPISFLPTPELLTTGEARSRCYSRMNSRCPCFEAWTGVRQWIRCAGRDDAMRRCVGMCGARLIRGVFFFFHRGNMRKWLAKKEPGHMHCSCSAIGHCRQP
jgi:hypothetical protein